MGFLANATTIPGKGTVLVADPDTAPPADYLTLDPTGDLSVSAPGWVAVGHTSRDNNVSMSKDGGDATARGSWWTEDLRSDRAATTWSMTANSIQVDAVTMGLAFGGGTLNTAQGFYDVGDIVPQKKAVFVLIVDSGGSRMALYVPSTSVAIGDAPEFPTDSFFEIQLAFAIQSSAATGKKFRWYHPALKMVAPAITDATPPTATTGSTLTITGTGFTGTTQVTIGGTPATSFAVVSDTEITAIMPAGAAGSSPIKVTNGVGTSNSFAYSRGA